MQRGTVRTAPGAPTGDMALRARHLARERPARNAASSPVGIRASNATDQRSPTHSGKSRNIPSRAGRIRSSRSRAIASQSCARFRGLSLSSPASARSASDRQAFAEYLYSMTLFIYHRTGCSIARAAVKVRRRRRSPYNGLLAVRDCCFCRRDTT